VRLRAELEQAFRQAAGEVLEFVRPRRWPFGERRAEAADEEFLFDLLEDLGYRARVETESPGAFYAPGNRFQIALDEWASDYPAASNFFINRFTCGSTLTPNSGLCDPEFDRMVDRALRVQQADPSAAGALWASIDRTVVDQALYVWLENPVVVDFVSTRVGNYQYSSTWEVLLSQLWVR